MRTAPYIDPAGVARERERAPYTVALVNDDGQYRIAFLPLSEDRLTCLKYVGCSQSACARGSIPTRRRRLSNAYGQTPRGSMRCTCPSDRSRRLIRMWSH